MWNSYYISQWIIDWIITEIFFLCRKVPNLLGLMELIPSSRKRWKRNLHLNNCFLSMSVVNFIKDNLQCLLSLLIKSGTNILHLRQGTNHKRYKQCLKSELVQNLYDQNVWHINVLNYVMAGRAFVVAREVFNHRNVNMLILREWLNDEKRFFVSKFNFVYKQLYLGEEFQ